MNYLPKGEAEVIRNETNRVIKVIAVWRGKKVPFVMAEKKVVRDDYFNPGRPVIPGDHYRKMYRQVVSVFAENKTKERARDLYWLLSDLSKCGVSLKGRGGLQITRWDKTAGQERKLIRQTVEEIGAAIRMQGHIIDGYSLSSAKHPGELDRLESIELVISQANQILLSWRQINATDKIELQRQLAKVVLQLENCRNEFKVATREQAEKVLPLKDSLGRPNPMAFASRTVAALSDLTERIRELNIIMPYIAMRKQLLVLADRWLRSIFNQTTGTVTLISRHCVFNGGSIANYEPSIIGQKIDQASSLLNNAVISPYYQLAKKAQVGLKSAKRLLQAKKYQACREKLNLALELLAAPVG